MKKKILAVVFLLEIIFLLGSTCTFAATDESSFEFSDGIVTKYVGISSNVVIPEKIGGVRVTAIGDYAFDECRYLLSLSIPDGVTSIGRDAFSGCTGLKSISIPDSVTSIGDSAFWGCKALASVKIPEGVTRIGVDTFNGCSGLKSISIPSGVTKLGSGAFYKCSSLTDMIIPDSVTCIGDSAFSECTGLKSITIPQNVSSVGAFAFECCTSLKSVVVGENVISIGSSAFELCTGLTDITLSGSVEEIQGYAFYDCEALETVFYDGAPANWNRILIIDGNLPLTEAERKYLCAMLGEILPADKGYSFSVVLNKEKIDSYESAVLIVNLYDGGKFVGFKKVPVTKNQESISGTVETAETAKDSRLMLWADEDTLKPLCESTSVDIE